MGRYKVMFSGDVEPQSFTVVNAGQASQGWIYVFETPANAPKRAELVPCRTPHLFEGDAIMSAMQALRGLGAVERVIALDEDKPVEEKARRRVAGTAR